jgi:frataxin-like iron-binding protein CyaY
VLEGKKPALCCIIAGNVIFVHFREMTTYIFNQLNAKGKAVFSSKGSGFL